MTSKQALWLVLGFNVTPVLILCALFLVGVMPLYQVAVLASLWVLVSLAIITFVSVRADLYAALDQERRTAATH